MDSTNPTDRVIAWARRNRAEGTPMMTQVPGLSVTVSRRPTELAPVIYDPIYCLVFQGAKEASLGSAPLGFAAGQSLIVGLGLPSWSRIVLATPDRPYAALALQLDPALLAELAADLPMPAPDPAPAAAFSVAPTDPAVRDAMLRAFALLDDPAAIPVLAPLILREIHYRLLVSHHGAALRVLARAGSPAARIAAAIARIRRDFAHALPVVELARDAGMSLSTFHDHFRTVTGTTPLQFQKRLRLFEARRLLQAGHLSVTAAAFQVGYQSPTQFSREYRREFAAAPSDRMLPAA